MQQIEISDLLAITISDFVKVNKGLFVPDKDNRIPFLKMNFKSRKNITEKFIDHIADEIRKNIEENIMV